MWNRSYDSFIGCDADFADAEIVLFGAPFDSTASGRPGSRFGPRAIRQESFGLETYSPLLDKDLSERRILDLGDIELPLGSPDAAAALITERTGAILNENKLPFMLGGEHSLTLGAVRAALKKYPELHIIHFDAHTDLREEYLGEKLSHACVIRRCWELLGDGRISQFGIRSGERDEFIWAKSHTRLRAFDFDGLEQLVHSLKKTDTPVYFTVDLDVLDPSALPGTGTPEAGGVSFRELIDAILLVLQARVVACDVMELAPPLDVSGVSTATACKVIREMLISC